MGNKDKRPCNRESLQKKYNKKKKKNKSMNISY